MLTSATTRTTYVPSCLLSWHEIGGSPGPVLVVLVSVVPCPRCRALHLPSLRLVGHWVTQNGYTALLLACYFGHAVVVKWLVEVAGVDWTAEKVCARSLSGPACSISGVGDNGVHPHVPCPELPWRKCDGRGVRARLVGRRGVLCT